MARFMDYPFVIGYGDREFDVLLKLLRGDELTDEEDKRAEQILETHITAKRVRNGKRRSQEESQNSQKNRRCKTHRKRDEGFVTSVFDEDS